MMDLESITNYVKGRSLQWLDDVMRREVNETLRRLMKRWIDIMEKYLKSLGVENWRGSL